MAKSDDILKKYGITQVKGSENGTGTTGGNSSSSGSTGTGVKKADDILSKYGIAQVRPSSFGTAKEWSDAGTSLLSEVQESFSKWRKTNDDEQNKLQAKINSYISQAERWRSHYADDDEVVSYIDSMVSALSKASSYASQNHKYYSQWDTEDAYIKGAGENREQRQQIYEANKKRIEEIDSELPWYGKTFLPSSVEKWFLSDDKDALMDEREALVAENLMYERGEGGWTSKVSDDYYKVTQAPDFETGSANRNHGNPTRDELTKYDALTDSSTWYYDENDVLRDAFGNEIVKDASGNLVNPLAQDYTVTDRLGLFLSASERDIEEYSGTIVSGTWGNIIGDGLDGSWNQLTKDEIDIYYYLLNSSGQETADKYLADMKTELNRRQTLKGIEQWNASYDEANLLEKIALNAASVPVKFLSNITGSAENAAHLLRGENINPYSFANSGMHFSSTVRGNTAEELDATGFKVPLLDKIGIDFTLGDIYQTGMSRIDSALATTVFGGGGVVFLGMGAAQEEAYELYKQGASEEQITIGAFSAGAAEAIWEKLSYGKLKEIENVGSPVEWIKSILVQGFNEASEEALTEVSNIISNALVMGSQSDLAELYKQNKESALKTFVDLVNQAAHSAFGGFLGGIGAGTAQSTSAYVDTTAKYRNAGSAIMSADGGVDALKNLANEIAGVSDDKMKGRLTKQAGKVSSEYATGDGIRKVGAAIKNISNETKVGRLYDTVQTANDLANAPANQADIAKSLQRKGFNAETANDIAAALVAQHNGQELSKAQAKLLESVENSQTVKKAISDIMNNAKSTMGQRSDNIRNFNRDVAIGSIAKAYGISADKARMIAEGKMPAQEENLPDSHYEVSADGKTIDKDGNIVTIQGIASLENGRMVLQTENGTVDAKDVSYASQSEALVYEAVANLEGIIDTDTANKLSKHLMKLGDVSSDVYAKAIVQAYTYGYYGYGRDAMTGENTLSATLSEKQRNVAYGLGEQYRNAKTDADQAKAATATVQKTAQTGKSTAPDGTQYQKVRFEGKVKKWGKKQKAEVAYIDFIASNFSGNTVHVFESYKAKNGKYYYEDSNGKIHAAPNGMYIDSTGDIYLDLNAGNHGEGLVMNTFAHELYHHIQRRSPEKARKLAEFLVQELGYESVEAAVQRQIDKAEKAGHGVAYFMEKGMSRSAAERMVYDRAFNDFVADSLETMFTEGDAIGKLQNLKSQDEGLFNMIKDFINKWVKKLREFYRSHSTISIEGDLVRQLEKFEQIQQMFVEALVDAGDNFRAAQEQFSTDSIRGTADGAVAQSEVATALTESEDVLNSDRTEFEALPKQMMSLSTGAGTLLHSIEGLIATKIKGLSGKTINGYTGRDVRGYAMGISGFTKAQIKEVNKFMDAMADFMEKAGVTYKFIGLQDVKDAKLHYTYNADGSIKSIVLSAMVKNGDYPVNFDLSSICKKRVAMSKLIDNLARRGSLDSGTVKLTPANIFKINTALKNAGYETACLGCFVESKRYNSLEWANKFCNKWNAAVKKVNPNATYFGYGNATFNEDSFTLEQAMKIDAAANKYITATKTERLANALAKYRAKEEAGLPLVESLTKAARERLVKADISEELKTKYLNSDVTTLNMADVEFLLENGILPGATLSNKQAVTELVKSGEAYQHLLRPSDLLTDRGISKLEALPNFHGVLYGHYGSGTPKLMQSYTPYNSEIALLPNKKGDQSLAEYLYTIAGVRMQSFSDFQIQNIYDYLQMVADLAARKVPAHAYTKEISFAKLLGMTGIKVNLSVMFDIDPMVDKAHAGLTKLNKLVHRGEYAKVVLEDAQGKWVYNIGDYQTQKLFAEAYPEEAKRFLQSIGFADAVKLQSSTGYSANCGIIGVGYSDLGIFAMLDDNRIRYIIPYHASSLPAEIKLATHIALGTDYTPYQNNMKIKEIVDRNGNKVNWTIKEAYKRLGSGQAVINELNEKVRNEGWVVSTTKAQTGHGTYGLYENLQETNDPRQTASNFMDWCIGNSTLPLFYQFASHENYYKLLYDYNVYDCVTEEYAPQQAVTNTYPTMVDGEVQPGTVTDGGFDAEYLQGTIDKQMAFMDEYNSNLDEDLERLADSMEDGTLFSDRVSDKETLAFLNEQLRNGEVTKVYRAMQVQPVDEDGNVIKATVVRVVSQSPLMVEAKTFGKNGKVDVYPGRLFSPMAGVVNGKWSKHIELNAWEETTYDLANAYTVIDEKTGEPKIDNDKKNASYGEVAYFYGLVKGGIDDSGKKLTDVPARYNPYIHTSLSALNDQFSSANKRPELVTVECLVPNSELTSGERAEGAKDRVGAMSWHSGPTSSRLAKVGKARTVILTRYDMPVRVLPDSEVAKAVAEYIGDTENIAIKGSTVTPSLSRELMNLGISVLNEEQWSQYDKDFPTKTFGKKKKASAPTSNGPEIGTLYSSRDVTSWDINWDEDNNSSIKSQMVKHMAEINRMNPVADIEFDKSKGKTYANILDEVLRTKFGYKIDRADGASFLFDKVAIATLRRYVTTDEEAAAVTAAPYVLKRGKAISGHKNHKGNRYPSVTYAGPVNINGERVNVGVVVLFGDKNRPHSLRVLMPSGNEYVLKKTETDSGRRWALPDGSVRSSTESASDMNVAQTETDVKKYSDRDDVPTFYSQMAKVIEGVKQEKLGAASVVSMLRGKGVKAEEIKWSGIEEWLAGKKSVTKAELQEFIAGSMLHIEEEVLDNKDRPYTEDQRKRLDEYEAKRDEVAKSLVAEWKKITGDDFPVRNPGADLESVVVNKIIDANKEHKDKAFEGRLLKKLRNDLKEVIANNDDFGFDSWKDALRSIHRHRRDFISNYEMSSNDKAVIVKYCNALNAYNELPNLISDADSDRLRAIARETEPWTRKIMGVKHERNEEEAKYMTNWGQYTLKGGRNYREVLFRIPGSTYTNEAMMTHWKDRNGVLAHARVQDMDTFIGTMLFIEEIQSDWHNEGHKSGYRYPGVEDKQTLARKMNEYTEEFFASPIADVVREKIGAIGYEGAGVSMILNYLLDGQESMQSTLNMLSRKGASFTESEVNEIAKYAREYEDMYHKWQTAPGELTAPDAPFKENYHEYVLKRLLREAAEQDYVSIGWTTAETQDERWANNRPHKEGEGKSGFLKGYTIEYDQEIPKFLNKYGKKWGASVGKTVLDNGTEVWSMFITDEMKESALTEGQPLYQDRDTDSVSNRSLLANAFEGVAKDDLERNKIREYKGQIDLINAEERKLSELNEKIRELSFAKGPKDTKAIRDLQFEARQTANRINTYDKILLRLEASKPLQDVLAREKKLAYQKAEKQGKEALAAYKERAAKTQRELMDRWQESRKRGIESREKTFMRHKIQSVVGELNQLLLSNDKKRHVPDSLKKAVADALALVNMDTVGAEERAAKYAALIAKETDPDKIDAYTMTMENILRQGDKMGQRLKELRDAYEEIQDSDDPDIANAYDPVIAGSLKELAGSIGNTSLRNMTIEQLSDVYDMYKMVLTRVRDANKSFLNEKKEAISALASRVVGEVKVAGGEHKYRAAFLDFVRKFGWNNLKPVYAFEHIGSSTLTGAFNNVRKGEDVWAIDVTEAREYYLDKSKKYGYDSWDFKKKYRFESASGLEFELTLDQILSLYAYSKREQAHEHLKLGGFVFDSNIETYKEQGSKIIKYRVNTADAHQITPDILANIISNLSGDQKGFVDEMQDYLSTVMGAKGNEITMKMYGVKLFKEKFYFPLKSAKQFMFEQNEVSGEVRIKNSGFTNKVVAHANNPVILSNFMDVWSGHVNDMSMYHAFVLPLEDFNRIFNYNSPKLEGQPPVSVKGTIQSAYTPAAVSYVKQLITDLNGGARSDPATGPLNWLMGKFKKGSVFASLSVVVQQPSAIARAAALVDTKYFIGPKVDHKRHKALWDEVKKYAPVAIIKEMGYFDTNMGKSTQDFITAKEHDGWLDLLKRLDVKGLGRNAKDFVVDSDYRDEVLSWGPAFADELAWCSIWEAVKREMHDKHSGLDVNSEPFLMLCGSRFTEVITKTQVYDSVLSRSAHMRSKDTGMKMVTAFMAEPTTSINMIADALLQGKRGNRKYCRAAIGAVIASQILNSILVSFVYAGRDDDEEEAYWEKYIGTLTGEILDGLNPAEYIPFIKDIVSIAKGYDVERSDMAVFSDLVNAIQKLGSDKLSVYRKVEGFAGSIAQIFGLPVKNIMRDARGICQTIDSFVNGEKTTGAGIGYAVKGAITGKDVSNQQQLYEAYLSGDQAQISRVESRYKDKNAAHSALRMALRENDPRIREAAIAWNANDLDEYMRLAKAIIAEKHFTQDDVVMAIRAEASKLEPDGDTSSTSKAKGLFTTEKFVTAIAQGDEATANAAKMDIIQTAQKNGKTKDEAEKSFASSVKSEMKEQFLAGAITESQAIDTLVDYCGETHEDAEEYVGQWVFQQEYGFSWSDRADAYKSGKISAHELVDILVKVGGKTEEESLWQVKIYDWQNEGFDIDSNQKSVVEDYETFCEPAGIDKHTYFNAYLFYADSGEEGVAYSKTIECMPYIDSLPLSKYQKTALAKCWWAESTVNKYKTW